MSDCVIGLTEYDRMVRAKVVGHHADLVFRNICAELHLNIDEALKAPLLSIATRRARLPAFSVVRPA